MSQENMGRFPTNNKKYSLSETNGFIPRLEKSFLRLRQLNESVSHILGDLGVDADNLGDLDLLNNSDDSNEATYMMLTDLKLYLTAIQDTIRELSETGCLIDNLDQGKVVWPAAHSEQTAEIFWSFGDKQCKLISNEASMNNDIYLVPSQADNGVPVASRLNED